MPRPKGSFSTPKYCLHKSTGHGYATIDGRQVWFGPYGEPASVAAHDRTIAEWPSRGRSKLPPMNAATSPCSITEVIAAFWEHAKVTYRPAQPTKEGCCPDGELGNYWIVLRVLRLLYGEIDAVDFGPLKQQALRQEMIRLGWSRRAINRQVSRVRSVFAWVVSQELIPDTVLYALQSVICCAWVKAAELERITLPDALYAIRMIVDLQPAELGEVERVGEAARAMGITEDDPVIIGEDDIPAIRENAAITLGIFDDRSPVDDEHLSPRDLFDMYEAAAGALHAWEGLSGERPIYFTINCW